MACSDCPIKPIAWIGRMPVSISKLNRDLSRPSKSEFSDQPPGCNISIEVIGLADCTPNPLLHTFLDRARPKMYPLRGIDSQKGPYWPSISYFPNSQ